MLLGVVIPVYHGSQTVAAVVDALLNYMKENHQPCRVALVADGGGAEDQAAVRALWEAHTGVTAVLLQANLGQQRALYEGLRELADCDVLVTMDDDGAHPVSLLTELLQPIARGADLCYAVPVCRGGPIYRRLGAMMRNLFFACLPGAPRGVRVSAYRAMTGELASRLSPEPDGFIYLSAAALRLKPRVSCQPYAAKPGAATTYTLRTLARLYGALLMHYTPLRRLRRKTPPFTVKRERLPGRGCLWEP